MYCMVVSYSDERNNDFMHYSLPLSYVYQFDNLIMFACDINICLLKALYIFKRLIKWAHYLKLYK
jgi:hypothetical protein